MSRLLPTALLGLLLVPVLGPATAAFAGGDTRPVGLVHSDRPPTESTGGFGEDTCAFCHLDGELNEEGGTLELLGLPEDGWEPGRTYRLQVRLSHPELRRAGFQLTARVAEGEGAGEQAGELAPGEGQLLQSPSYLQVSYLSHGTESNRPVDEGEGRWAFHWTAPSEGGAPITFHAAANAADGDGSEWGDRIYTLEVILPATAGR